MNEWDDWTNGALVRQWWYIYAQVLLRPAARTKWHAELEQLTAACEARGIVRDGRPMPRDGAEDLADQCDVIRKAGR